MLQDKQSITAGVKGADGERKDYSPKKRVIGGSSVKRANYLFLAHLPGLTLFWGVQHTLEHLISKIFNRAI